MIWFLKTNLSCILNKYGNSDIEKSYIPLFTHENIKHNYPSKYMKGNYDNTKSYLIMNGWNKAVGMFIVQPKMDNLKLAYPIIRHFEIFKGQCRNGKHYGTKALRKLIRKYKTLVLQAHDNKLIKYYEKNGFTLFSKTGNIMTIDIKQKKRK